MLASKFARPMPAASNAYLLHAVAARTGEHISPAQHRMRPCAAIKCSSSWRRPGSSSKPFAQHNSPAFCVLRTRARLDPGLRQDDELVLKCLPSTTWRSRKRSEFAAGKQAGQKSSGLSGALRCAQQHPTGFWWAEGVGGCVRARPAGPRRERRAMPQSHSSSSWVSTGSDRPGTDQPSG